MQEITKLYRTSEIYRPLFVMVNDKEYELKNIIVYDENGIVFENGYGYFDNNEELEIKGNVVRKVKETFKGKDNYVLKFESDNWYGDKLYALYLHKDNVDFKFLGKAKRGFGDIYSNYLLNGIKICLYETDIRQDFDKYNKLAEEEIKKLQECFGYYKKGADKEELKRIFNNLLEYNKKIKAEVKMINEYKID